MPLGLRENSTGNATVAWELLLNLVDHDLDLGWVVLQLTDGVRAIGAAVEALLGAVAAQRCVCHKADLARVWGSPFGSMGASGPCTGVSSGDDRP